jgi:hypothetical protein
MDFYENQNLWCNNPLIVHIITVCSINIIPIASPLHYSQGTKTSQIEAVKQNSWI